MGVYTELMNWIKYREYREGLEEKENLSLVHHYGISTATAYMNSFSHICDVLGDFDGKATKEELLKKNILDDEWLSCYVRWDVLQVKYEHYYYLTDLGKRFYFKNKSWRNK